MCFELVDHRTGTKQRKCVNLFCSCFTAIIICSIELQSVQECDATDVASSAGVRYPKIKNGELLSM